MAGEIYPELPILAFFVFLAFFVLRFSLLFLDVFAVFFKDFNGSAERKILVFFPGDPRFFASPQGT